VSRASRGHFRCRVAIPNAEQKNLAAIGVFEDVVDAIDSADLEKSRATGIGALRGADTQERAQLSDLFGGVVPQIFQNGRLFWDVHNHGLFPPASESPHIDKDVGTLKMFHAFLLKKGYFMEQIVYQ
jgi:hypothetical protein